MHVLREMVEKILEVQGSMALGCVDLEKAFDTVLREMVMATLRWRGVPEAEVRMVEGMYEKTTARVVVGEGASEAFDVKIGLRQGSVLSPLLFISVLDLISRNMALKDAMKKLLYADDLALVANWRWGLEQQLDRCRGGKDWKLLERIPTYFLRQAGIAGNLIPRTGSFKYLVSTTQATG